MTKMAILRQCISHTREKSLLPGREMNWDFERIFSTVRKLAEELL